MSSEAPDNLGETMRRDQRERERRADRLRGQMMTDERMVPSRNHRSDIRESMYDAHPANVAWLEEHGYEFGPDATGMAYHVVSPRGIRIAGPDGTAETCSHNGRRNAEETLRETR